MKSTPEGRGLAVVTGGSAGLGQAIASELFRAGYSVAIIGRNQDSLTRARDQIREVAGTKNQPNKIHYFVADLMNSDDVGQTFAAIAKLGEISVLVNNVGTSDRGSVEQLTSDRIMEVVGANLIPTLLCSRAALASLARRQGVIINIGSLAAKVGARYLGGYPAAKHALAGLTQQMRLEWKSCGVHVGLINPGPIRRDDGGSRYQQRTAGDPNLPASASQPGGGTRIKGLAPETVARKVLKMIERRQADVMLPAHLRPLVAIGNLWPPLGDWLLLKFTKSSDKH